MNRLFFSFALFLSILFTSKDNWENFRQNKKLNDDCSTLSFYLRTQSRDRTGMEVNPLVFETSASTDSAIWA